jgi:hypothetical protein
MAIEEQIALRLQILLDQAPQLTQGNEHGQVRSEEHRQQCAGWLASASNLAQRLCPNPESAYRVQVDRVVAEGIHYGANDQVGEIAAILRAPLTDAQHGLLTSIADRARAETFDDFLDHASAYLKENRKNESGVIVGIVFEDSVRRACRKHSITEKGVQLDDLISSLARIDALSAAKAKRARAAAHVRTKATHAQWDEFDLDDVRAAIEFTREFIANELDS